MSFVLLFLTTVLMYMYFITSVVILHGAFFALGLCTAITDTGCQIMTRKLHGAKAGPWLGANTVAFGVSGALVPLIGYLTGSLFIQYVILATVSCMVAAFLIVLPAPEKYEGLLEVSRCTCRQLQSFFLSMLSCFHARLSNTAFAFHPTLPSTMCSRLEAILCVSCRATPSPLSLFLRRYRNPIHLAHMIVRA